MEALCAAAGGADKRRSQNDADPHWDGHRRPPHAARVCPRRGHRRAHRGGGGLLGGIGAEGGVGSPEAARRGVARAGSAGDGAQLDLSKLGEVEVTGDRPDEDGRQPPTPTALIVERLKAAAAAAAAEKENEAAPARSAAGGGAPAVPPTHSTSLPDARRAVPT